MIRLSGSRRDFEQQPPSRVLGVEASSLVPMRGEEPDSPGRSSLASISAQQLETHKTKDVFLTGSADYRLVMALMAHDPSSLRQKHCLIRICGCVHTFLKTLAMARTILKIVKLCFKIIQFTFLEFSP